MTKAKLKEKLYKLIDEEQDSSRLKLYKDVMENASKQKGDFWDKLPKEEQDAIDAAATELDNGGGHDYKDIRKEIKEKLGF